MTLSAPQIVPQKPPSDDRAPIIKCAESAVLEFGANGRKYRQIWRSGNIAVLEARMPDGPLTSYEVVVIRVQAAYERFGQSYPAKELYPNNERWGELGWSFGVKHKDFALEAAASLVGVPGKIRRDTMHAYLGKNRARMRQGLS